jgi:transposase
LPKQSRHESKVFVCPLNVIQTMYHEFGRLIIHNMLRSVFSDIVVAAIVNNKQRKPHISKCISLSLNQTNHGISAEHHDGTCLCESCI